MERVEFNILLNSIKKGWKEEDIAKISFSSVDKVNNAKQNLIDKGYLDRDYGITQNGREAMAPYKVDNAIIMAAGSSSRCLPLSNIIPKGLFRVKGEILLEREIEQLRAAGIEEIILVTGYMAEKFAYLKDKYGITIVKNHEYKERNNTSSLFAARKYMKNSYICCADNYFKHNIFQPYVYDSYYTCKYTEKFLDEFCLLDISKDGYIKSIHRGGKNCWYTMGATYYSQTFSEKFLELLIKEYDDEETKGMLIDTFHANHLDELPVTFMGYPDDEIFEFDTLKEFSEFDTDFNAFYSEAMENNLFERYKGISRYAGVPTDWLSGRLHYNENLWGPSPKCIDAIYQTTMEDLYLYDSAEDDDLLLELEKYLKISRNNMFLHNGSAESIKSLFHIMLNPGDNVLLPAPGWSYYASVVGYKFGNVIYYDIIEKEKRCVHNIKDIVEKAQKYNPKLIVITSPAMPTGNMVAADDLEIIVKMNPGTMVLVDEAYYGFAGYDIDINRFIQTYDNVVFSRTFSKYFGLANLRIGYGICSKKTMRTLWLDLPLHRLPHISKKMAIAALNDNEYYKTVSKEIIEVRDWFRKELNKIPNVLCFETDSNFVYVKLCGYKVIGVRDYMYHNGYLIRVFENHGEQHLRITIAPKEIMEDCMNKLKAALEENKI